MSLLDELRGVERHHFGRMPGDASTWSVDDGAGAVRLARSAPFLAVDIETGSARTAGRHDLKCVSLADTGQSHVLHPVRQRAAIRDALAAAKVLVFHNASYDVPTLVMHRLMEPGGIDRVQDTMISARLGRPSEGSMFDNRLGPLGDRVLGEGYSTLKATLEAGFKAVNPRLSKSDMFDVLSMDASRAYLPYAAFDTLLTARIYAAMPGRLADALNPGLPSFRPADAAALNLREQTVNRMLLRQSVIGIRFDDGEADRLVGLLREKIADNRGRLMADGIDPDAGAAGIKRQILDRLDAAGLIPGSWPRLKDGSLSTRRDWMARLDEHPTTAAALAVIRSERFIRDYRDKGAGLAMLDGLIHPEVSVLAARTGRMSYKSPPLQQWPPEVRSMFAFDRPATSFDWASIEPVLFANLVGETAMIDRFESGGDIYLPVAERAGVDRSTAKVVLLAALYGQGVAALALRLGIAEDAARGVQRAVMAAMPAVSQAIRRITAYGNQHGWAQTISGRPIPIDPDPTTGSKRFYGYRGTNYAVQGSAYDLLAESLLAIHRAGLGDAVRLAIHDELVVDSDAAEDVARIMTTPPPALVEAAGRVPVLRVGRTELGLRWQAKD